MAQAELLHILDLKTFLHHMAALTQPPKGSVSPSFIKCLNQRSLKQMNSETENALHFPAIHCILTGHFMNYILLVPGWTAFKLNSLQ